MCDVVGEVTLLHEAVRAGAFDVITLLVARGADPFVADRRGGTPLHWAAAYGTAGAAMVLLEAALSNSGDAVHGQLLNALDNDGWTALDHAEASSHVRAASALVRAGGRRGQSIHGALEDDDGSEGCPAVMIDAVLSGDVAKLSTAKRSVSANCKVPMDAREWSLLHLGTAVASLELVTDGEQIVAQLLEMGADASLQDAYGQTSLFLATKAGQLHLMELLLDAAPDAIDHRDVQRRTALICAAAVGAELAVVQLLLARGARAELQDNEAFSALDWAEMQGSEELVEALSMQKGVRGASRRLQVWPSWRPLVHRWPMVPPLVLVALAVLFGCVGAVPLLAMARHALVVKVRVPAHVHTVRWHPHPLTRGGGKKVDIICGI